MDEELIRCIFTLKKDLKLLKGKTYVLVRREDSTSAIICEELI